MLAFTLRRGVKNLKRKAIDQQVPTVVIDLCEEKSEFIAEQGPSSVLVQSTDGSEFSGAQQMGSANGEAEEQFDVGACRNFGKPIMVEWEGKVRPFIDGLGLCSPTRWLPSCREFLQLCRNM